VATQKKSKKTVAKKSAVAAPAASKSVKAVAPKTTTKRAAKPVEKKPVEKKAVEKKAVAVKATKKPVASKAVKPVKPVVAKSTQHAALRAGIYTTPSGNVSVALPSFWFLQQTNDDLSIESADGKTSVIVTAYCRTDEAKLLDAREYLHHYFETAPHKGGFTELEHSSRRASARYRDEDGNGWLALFLSDGQTLLLATLSTNGSLASKEAKTGLAVLESLKLVKAKK